VLDNAPEVHAIPGGVVVSERLNRLWKLSAKTITVTELSTGMVVKNLALMDIDNIDVRGGGGGAKGRGGGSGGNDHKATLPRRNPDGTRVPPRRPVVQTEEEVQVYEAGRTRLLHVESYHAAYFHHHSNHYHHH
jgi:hypothetical protein